MEYIVFWALWRRILGGWFGLPRWSIVSVGALAASLPFVMMGGNEKYLSLVAIAAMALWFLPSHNYGDAWPCIKRYLGIGAIGYIIAKRFKDKIPGGCWSCIGEIWVGATFGLFYALALGNL